MYRLTIRIRSDDTIRPNTNTLSGQLFGTEANTKQIFGTSLVPSDINWIYLIFLCYYVAWPCDLYLFDHGRVYTLPRMPDPHTSFHYPMINELWITEFDHTSVIENIHCTCAMSSDLSPGGKNSPHFWNPWSQFTYIHFVTFRVLRRRLSHVIGEK